MSHAQVHPFPEIAKKWQEEERKARELEAALRTNCVDVLEDLASAMRFPRISVHHLESALAKIRVALDCAKALDK
jgi:hypothetical protein